jgi:phage terminase large subunit-like protein
MTYRKTVAENPWIPKRPPANGPWPKQQRFLLHTETQEVLYGGAAGGGKALYNGSMIPTPDGWTAVANLRPGDFVFGADGKPTLVLAVSDVMLNRECWRLTFDDGNQIVADAEHRWLTYSASELNSLTRRDPRWREARRSRRQSRVGGKKSKRFTAAISERNRKSPPKGMPPPSGTIRTTEGIAATLRCGKRANHAVPIGGALDLPEAELPLDPYVLGAWLGDGTSTGGGFTSADEEVVAIIRRSGWSVTKRGGKHPYAWLVGTPGRAKRSNGREGIVNPFAATLRQMGVLGNKHVPAAYLRASRAQRLALLQGLMDTDGTVARRSGSAEFVNTNRRLAEAVCELACSLGHKARLREGRSKLRGRDCGPKWTVKWVAPEIVFRLRRKAELQKIAERRTRQFRYIVACERVTSVPVQCIKVAAPDGLFLAGAAMIPTHNSDALLMAAAQFVDVPGYAALLLRSSFPDLMQPDALIPRSKEWWHGRAAWNAQDRRWTFPGGATITFGYLERDDDVYQYQGAAYQFIGIDETTQHTEFRYRYLFSRLRRPSEGALSAVPLRMRSATNPGGKGHEWVKARFIDPAKRARGTVFVPAKLEDNPSLDATEYIRSLAHLDPTTRAQLLAGDWEAHVGGRFKASWLKRWHLDSVGNYVLGGRKFAAQRMGGVFLTVDPAATVKESVKDDPDYTATSAWRESPDGDLVWLGVSRDRVEIPDIGDVVAAMYLRHGAGRVYCEGFGIGKGPWQLLRRHRLPSGALMNVIPVNPGGRDKLERAAPALNLAEAGRLWVPMHDPSFEDSEAELLRWTGDEKKDSHDDIVDDLIYAAKVVTDRKESGGGSTFRPKTLGAR